MQCIRCGSTATRRDGRTRLGGQRWRCHRCQRRFTARSTSAFSRCCFSDGLVALAIRWYLRFRLSYADVVEWLAERGIMVDRSTVYRWVQRFLPLFAKAARFHRQPVGRKWRVDETYCRLNGRWAYCYRAIDQDSQVVDPYFSERRNAAAARVFFEWAIAETGLTPERVITDRARCYPPALRAVLPTVEHRCSRYLHNILERDHGHLKQWLGPRRGFKHPASADNVVRDHALVQNLRNGFSTLTATVERRLRLLTAWPQLAQLI